MADFFSLSAPDLLQRATTLFTGIRDTPEILAALAPFEVELDDEVKRGLALVEEVRAEIGRQGAEGAEQVGATATSAAAHARLEARLARDRKLARATHRPGSAEHVALGLGGAVPDGDAEMVAMTDAFYRAAEASPDLVAGVRGLGKAAVTAGLALVEAAREAEAAQTKETGEAQHATSLRQDAEVRLRALADEVADVTEVALEDEPQRREVVGLFERGSA